MTNLSAKTQTELSSIDRKIANVKLNFNAQIKTVRESFDDTITLLNAAQFHELAEQVDIKKHLIIGKLHEALHQRIEKIWKNRQ